GGRSGRGRGGRGWGRLPRGCPREAFLAAGAEKASSDRLLAPTEAVFEPAPAGLLRAKKAGRRSEKGGGVAYSTRPATWSRGTIQQSWPTMPWPEGTASVVSGSGTVPPDAQLAHATAGGPASPRRAYGNPARACAGVLDPMD